MHQILSLRPTPNGKKTDNTHFKNGWNFPNLQQMLLNPDAVLTQIPESERWNLYFTINQCTTKKRDFHQCTHIPFDIDHINTERIPDYIQTFSDIIGVEKEKIGTICSGNGLQFFIELTTPTTDKKFFEQNRIYYHAICKKIDAKLKELALTGNTDKGVFDAARLMRLPNTENRKPHGSTKSYVINPNLVPVDFSLKKLAGIPEISEKDYVRLPRELISIDEKAIMEGCQFLKTLPDFAHEPHAYAAMSFFAHFNEPERITEKTIHQIQQKGHSETINAWSLDETLKKLDQAERASGPRTCENINSLWGKCHTCPHFKKINSPISIQGPDFIKTLKSGFYNISVDPNTGMVAKTKPNYDDLAKFFEKKYGRFVAQAKSLYTYKNHHYTEQPDDIIENFAEKHMDPKPTNQIVAEFKGKILRTNVVDETFWKNTAGKINLKNGVLDVHSGSLSNHSPDLGFRYILDYDYIPEANCPRFETFLSEITHNNYELISSLLEFMGYAISGDEPWAAKMLILSGEGKNGKSTFIKCLKGLVGKKSYTTLGLQYLKSPERRASLDGALFNICEEAPRFVGDASDIKALASGDELMGRKLYKDAFFFRNYAKLIFSCNELPQSSDNSYGYYRRFLIIPFNRRFDDHEIDLEIDKKLAGEKAGILNLVLAAYCSLKDRGHFLEPEQSKESLDEYRELNDPVEAWFNDCLEITEKEDDRVFTDQLFSNYRAYIEKYGYNVHRDMLNAKSFGKKLKPLIPQSEQRKFKKEGGKRGYKGVCFKNYDADAAF